MNFKKILKQFREREHLSKTKLAELLGKTDAYIRKLENEGYTPPTFPVCEKITKILSLSKQEKKIFYKQAFIERIKGEEDFYKYVTTHDNKPAITAKSQTSNLHYFMAWGFKISDAELKTFLKENLKVILKTLCTKHNYYAHAIKITSNHIQFAIEAKATTMIELFAKNLKKEMESEIKLLFNNKIQQKSIWTDKTIIYTIGIPPNIDKDTFERSDTTSK